MMNIERSDKNKRSMNRALAKLFGFFFSLSLSLPVLSFVVVARVTSIESNPWFIFAFQPQSPINIATVSRRNVCCTHTSLHSCSINFSFSRYRVLAKLRFVQSELSLAKTGNSQHPTCRSHS